MKVEEESAFIVTANSPPGVRFYLTTEEENPYPLVLTTKEANNSVICKKWRVREDCV